MAPLNKTTNDGLRVANMAVIASAIPRLRGPDNFDQWHLAVIDLCNRFNIAKFLTETVSEPQDDQANIEWRIGLAAARFLLVNSTTDVHSTLLKAGLDSREPDPSKIYSKLLEMVCPDTENIHNLVSSLCLKNRSDFETMDAFLAHHQYARAHLRNFSVAIGDQFLMNIVIHKIKETLAPLHSLLHKEWEAGTLTWDSMIFQIRYAHRYERVPVAARRTTSQPQSRNYTGVPNGEIKLSGAYLVPAGLKDCPEDVLDKLVWCTQCKLVGITYGFRHCDPCKRCHFPGQHK